MIGKLNEEQIDDLLSKQIIGRIGCIVNGSVYVVPISYAYDGASIYAHTSEGLKIDGMRQNPEVCFEVEDLKDMANWQTVIAWGKFEELKERYEQNKALKLLLDRHLPIISSSTTHLGTSWPFTAGESGQIDGIFFKVTLTERTGKFESSSNCPNIIG